MKTIIITLFSLFLTTQVIAQEPVETLEQNVPVHILKNFSSRFPGVYEADWKVDANEHYQATFLSGKRDWETTWAPDGTLVSVSEEIRRKEFPVELGERVGEIIGGDFRVLNATRVEHETRGNYYEVEVRADGQRQTLFIIPEEDPMQEPQFTIQE